MNKEMDTDTGTDTDMDTDKKTDIEMDTDTEMDMDTDLEFNPKPHWLQFTRILHWVWASSWTLRQVVLAGGGGAAGAALPQMREQG